MKIDIHFPEERIDSLYPVSPAKDKLGILDTKQA